ncbi:MAG TPA: TlpA disulfide reductase family protein [Phycisphaerales bacterium]|nr:TlpA disulfide reductase family protein [Phycisphaerales bacterium]
MRTRSLLAALIAAAGTAGALAQETTPPATPPAEPAQPQTPAAEPTRQPQALEALRALDAAAAAVRTGFSAQVRSYAQGNSLLESFFPKVEGRWAQRPLENEGEWMVRYTGAGNVAGQSEPIEFDVLFQPDRVTWLDHEAKTYNVDRPKGRKGGEAITLPSSAWSQLEDLADTFTKATESSGLEMQAPAEVEGVMCDVVAIRAQPGTDAVLWYFGRDDHLPRRSEIVIPAEQMGGSFRVDFTEAASGPEAVADIVWEVPSPDGYEQKVARALQERPAVEPQVIPSPFPEPSGGTPDWEVADSEGAMVSPGSLRGKVAVLYFWGTWSPGARKATPEIKTLADAYAGKPVEVISMAFRESDPAAAVTEAEAQGQTWRQVPKADDAVSVIGIRTAPSVIVLGPEGELLYRSGRAKGDDYGAMVQEIRGIIDRVLAGESVGRKPADGPEAKRPGAGVSPKGATPARIPGKRSGG